MSHRSAKILGLSALALIATAGSAQATFFSFASDNNSNNFTFSSSAAAGGSFTITEANRPNSYTLLIDDNNGPLPSIPLTVELRANLTATNGQTFNLGGGLFQHTYRVSGVFGFYVGGAPLLTVNVGGQGGGVLTVPGSANAWSSSGAILGADSFTDVTYTSFTSLVNAIDASPALQGGTSAANYGIFAFGGSSSSAGPDDFGFTLTRIAGENGAVSLDQQTRLPTNRWQAESSFSGTAGTGIPAPGAASLLGIAGLIATRRRRTA